MLAMGEDSCCHLVTAYALGALGEDEGEAFRTHLSDCPACRTELGSQAKVLNRIAARERVATDPGLRGHVLELTEAPSLPLDLEAYTWDEVIPGVKMHTVKEDAERGIRTVLVWAQPGARYPTHRHLGDEEILVLKGRLRDHRGVYGPGDICRSRTGFVHSEEVLSGEDCICYVVYHGGHEAVPE